MSKTRRRGKKGFSKRKTEKIRHWTLLEYLAENPEAIIDIPKLITNPPPLIKRIDINAKPPGLSSIEGNNGDNPLEGVVG